MRNILLYTGILLLTLTSCQKDYYLDDLNEAEARIESLENQVNQLSNELTNAIASNQEYFTRLVEAGELIAQLNNEIEVAYQANINLGNINGELHAQITELENTINALNEEIAIHLADLNTELNRNELNVEEITRLTNIIAELEAREPEVIIEYIETVVTVIETQIETVTVVDTAEVDRLTAEVATLNALIDTLTADAVTDATTITDLQDEIDELEERIEELEALIPNNATDPQDEPATALTTQQNEAEFGFTLADGFMVVQIANGNWSVWNAGGVRIGGVQDLGDGTFFAGTTTGMSNVFDDIQEAFDFITG